MPIAMAAKSFIGTIAAKVARLFTPTHLSPPSLKSCHSTMGAAEEGTANFPGATAAPGEEQRSSNGTIDNSSVSKGRRRSDSELRRMRRQADEKARRQRDLGASYVEHTLGIEQLAEIHSDSYIDVEDPLNSSGLSTFEARKRLSDGGMNVLSPPKGISNWQLFYHQYFYKFWLLLLSAAVLSMVMYFIKLAKGVNATLNLTVAIILVGVVVIMSVLSCWQERRSIDILSGLELVLPHNCTVIRDCQEVELPSDQLVVGDIVNIRCGQRIHADVRILASSSLKIEASAITGDPQPVEYTFEVAASHLSVFNAHNVAFRGSYCTEGEGIGIVIRTGQYTMLGNFTEMEADARKISRHGLLHKELSKFVNNICTLAIGMAVLFFVVGCIVKGFDNVTEHFVTGFLIVIVANVPQGLPPTVMAQLAIIARRMAKKQVFIKKLDVIDELGAVTVVAADKAGTLTKDHLILTDLWYDKDHHSALEEIKRSHHLTITHHRGRLHSRHHPPPPAIGGSTKAAASTREATTSTPRRTVELASPMLEILSIMAMCNRAHYEVAAANPSASSSKAAARHHHRGRGGSRQPRADLVMGTGMRTLTKSRSALMLSSRVESHLSRSPSPPMRMQPPRTKKFTVIHETGGQSIRMPSTSTIDHPEELTPTSPISPTTSPQGGLSFFASALRDWQQSASVSNTISLTNRKKAASTVGGPGGGGGAPPGEESSETNTTTATPQTITNTQNRKRSQTAAGNSSAGCALDIALLRFVSQIANVEGIRERFRLRLEIPFNSVRCWQLVVAECLFLPKAPDAADTLTQMNPMLETVFVVMVKGAPEVVLAMCSQALVNGEMVEMDAEFKEACRKAWEYYGSKGSRVIALALRHFAARRDTNFTSPDAFPNDSLVFAGLVALLDPPKTESRPAILQCKEAGVKVYMITGDHPATALAVATKIGLIDTEELMEEGGATGGLAIGQKAVEQQSNGKHEDDCDIWQSGLNVGPAPRRRGGGQSTASPPANKWALVLGHSLRGMTKPQWDRLLGNHPYIVFARTTPEQKLLIVEECQRRGEIVAVTGGGVNDAPALARANIGIAMGASGSDVARKAANIILSDDNFASIVRGIEEGRLLFDNLRLSIAYTLAHLWPEVFPIVLNFALGMPLGLDPLQILSIDLACELPPAVSLAYEPPERDIMSVPPRGRNAPLVSNQLMAYSYIFSGVAITLGCLGAYLSVYWHYGISTTELLYTSEHHFTPLATEHFVAASSNRSYTPAEQNEIKGEAAAAWQITLVVCQVFHVFMCTTRRVSFFRHGIHNFAMIIAVMIEVLLLNLFVFTPSMQHFMRIATPPTHIWLFAPVVGVYLLVINEARKWVIRHRPKWRLSKWLKW